MVSSAPALRAQDLAPRACVITPADSNAVSDVRPRLWVSLDGNPAAIDSAICRTFRRD